MPSKRLLLYLKNGVPNLIIKVLMDLSKAFDSLNHELLIAKLHAYGFTKKALDLIFLSYTEMTKN